MTDARPDSETRTAVEGCLEELPGEFALPDPVFGFDGIVDNVRFMVDERHSETEYEPIRTLSELTERFRSSIDSRSSLTIEWETEDQRTGGHACHLTRIFGKWGVDPTMLGTYGQPPQEPFATEFGDYTIVSIGEPGYCDATEFDDGKLLQVETGDAAALDWDGLCERAGEETLVEHLDGADLLGVGYWHVTDSLPDILANLTTEIWPRLESSPDRLFLDPGDLWSLPSEKIRSGADRLAHANETVPVTVSANRSETEKLADDLAGGNAGDLREDVREVFEVLEVERFVGHSSARSVVATDDGIHAVEVPETDSPAMTTSAGDHFNAGLLLGLFSDLSESSCVVVGNAVAGWFVRNGRAPDTGDVRTFVDGYLDAFE